MGEYLVSRGCGHCDDAKKKGLCRDNICYDISSKTGQRIAKEANVNGVPNKICKTKSGKRVKCKPTTRERKKYGVS